MGNVYPRGKLDTVVANLISCISIAVGTSERYEKKLIWIIDFLVDEYDMKL